MTKALRVLVVLGAAVLGACSSDVAPGTVELVAGQRFNPATITIAAGDTITWKVVAKDAHTVTAYADAIPVDAEYFSSGGTASEEDAREQVASGLLEEGDTYEVTFDVPGTYAYFCIPHESAGMKGTVVVEG